MPDWSELFWPSVHVAETFVRGTVLFLVVYFLMRFIGKRETGSLSLTDLLVVVLVAQATSGGLTGNATSIIDAVILVATILFWSSALDWLAYKVPGLRKLLKSSPSPLITNGEVNHRRLRRELMEIEELESQLRLHGVTKIEDVALAYLETNGMISVIPKRKNLH